ncbi:MAG: carbamate kinase [Saccharofermentanales bacterium]|jgi:carbamate kinase|nr:carbamate kinase [Clostridiaceae bacterium]
MGKKVVVALGGNAILTEDPTAAAQIKALKNTSEKLTKLIEAGYCLIINHGNGPQVGNLLLQQEATDSMSNPAMPIDTAVAMTQGSIGYWLQNTLDQSIREAGLNKPVVTLLTQVVVSEDDPAFQNPTKPIGPFLSKEEADKRAAETGYVYVEDAGRGYRRVVPSPKPISIVEAGTIGTLVDNGVITISAGGGGIPVVKHDTGYEGIEAVIDKDFAAAKLAEIVKADYLVFLTGVDHAYVNFNKSGQKKIESATVEQMKQYVKEGHFAPGSMLPKVQASISFVESVEDGKAYITSLDNVEAIISGGSATVIKK